MSTEATPPSPVPDTTPASAEASTPDTPAAPEQKPAAEVPPPLPLPPEAEELDARVAAALVMVNHGIRRLSRLAGNIRFAFLQRDESRLVTERQKLKAAFQRQEHGPAELKFGLQALLQKAERMAGSLLYQPQNTAATTQAPSPKPDGSAQAAAPEATPAQADSPTSAAETPAANPTAPSRRLLPTRPLLRLKKQAAPSPTPTLRLLQPPPLRMLQRRHPPRQPLRCPAKRATRSARRCARA